MHENTTDISIPSAELEINKEQRLSIVLSLHSKGLTQYEIAQRLRLNQSTISRDLQVLKQEARRNLEKHLVNDIPFEFLKILKGLDEIIKTTWETIETKEITCKEKYHLLSLIDMVYTKRLQILLGGNPRDGGGLNLQSSLASIRANELCQPY